MITDELNCFLVVADCLSFTKAAEHLHIAQPVISRQISRMENQLGIQLFERTTRKVSLTAAGESYLKLCQMFLTGCENLLAEYPRFTTDETRRGITLGIGGVLESHYTTEILRRFSTKNPQIPINIVQHDEDELVELTNENQVDIAILPLPLFPDSIEYEYYAFDEAVPKVAVWKGHPLEKKKTVTIADLKNENFIVNSKAPKNLTNRLYRLCDRNNFLPRISCKSSSIQLSLMMVSIRQGIMFFTFHALANIPDNVVLLDVVDDSLKEEALESSLIFLWKKQKRLTSPALQEMVDVIRTVIEEIKDGSE